MALVIDATVNAFDLAMISRGDLIRLKRAGDTTWRNGFVTKTNPQTVEILYCNTQNNATSFLQISAADVAVGAWEIYWTTDFHTIHYENNAPGADSGSRYLILPVETFSYIAGDPAVFTLANEPKANEELIIQHVFVNEANVFSIVDIDRFTVENNVVTLLDTFGDATVTIHYIIKPINVPGGGASV